VALLVYCRLKRKRPLEPRRTRVFAKPASPRSFPALAPLAGSFASPASGKAVLRPEGDALMLELKETGAELGLTPWDGDVFTWRLLPRGQLASMGANMGEQPIGFAQFEISACCASPWMTDSVTNSAATRAVSNCGIQPSRFASPARTAVRARVWASPAC
jgi:hypothetical protein